MTLPHGLFVDMDGTLVDSESRWLIAETALMTELGGVWTREDQVACVGGPLDRLIRYMVAKIGADEREIPDLSQRLLVHVERAFRQEPLTWHLPVVDLLGQAHESRIPAVLVTASDRPLVDIVLEQLHALVDFTPFVDVVAGGDAMRGKPNPDPYLLAADRIAIDPRDALALEDSPTGVRAAIAAGCAVVAVPHLTPVGLAGAVEPGSLADHDLVTLWSLARDHRLENGHAGSAPRRPQ